MLIYIIEKNYSNVYLENNNDKNKILYLYYGIYCVSETYKRKTNIHTIFEPVDLYARCYFSWEHSMNR